MCVGVFIKLYITAQSDPVTLVIQCCSHRSSQGRTNDTYYEVLVCVCVCLCIAIPFTLDVRLVDVPAGVTQEEGHTGFLHLPSAVCTY